jgi:hypothetical protein
MKAFSVGCPKMDAQKAPSFSAMPSKRPALNKIVCVRISLCVSHVKEAHIFQKFFRSYYSCTLAHACKSRIVAPIAIPADGAPSPTEKIPKGRLASVKSACASAVGTHDMMF